MRTALVFPVLIAMISAVNWAISSNTANNQTPLPPKTCDKPVVYNCNLNQADSHVGEAINKLETNMKNLIALVNETLSAKTKPSAVTALSCEKQYDKHNDAMKMMETKLEKLIALVNKTSTPQAKPPVAPPLSCKQQYEKHNKDMKKLETKLENLIALVNKIPDPVVLFPLNAKYGTKEIHKRVAQGVPKGVRLAAGPDGAADGSYEFSGTSNSYIEFPNSAGRPLDVRYSMTMLCWVYHGGQDGPLFNYRTGGSWGVHLWVVSGKLFVRFNRRDYSGPAALSNTALAGGWKFVGASYDRSTGEAKLWVNGAVVQTLNIGAGLSLATQDSIRMGVRIGDRRYFKGRIAQMQVYNAALSQQQIKAIQQRNQVSA